MGSTTPLAAPALQVAHWLDTPRPLTPASLRGRVVVRHAFQMVVPGRQGRVRLQHLGRIDDLQLVGEPLPAAHAQPAAGGCDDRGCPLPPVATSTPAPTA